MTGQDIVKYYGGKLQAAIELEVTPNTIENWINNGIPKMRQSYLQLRANGALKADVIPQQERT